jgi:serine/threonine-protein kinase RsbW
VKTHFLEIESERNNINKVEALMLKANENFGLTGNKFDKMMIAVTEIIMNAIVHGNKENPGKKVRIYVEHDENVMRIVVTDEGEGFDIQNMPDPTISENLYDVHGRGVFIAKAMVDEFQYKHHQGKGSEFVMIVRKK